MRSPLTIIGLAGVVGLLACAQILLKWQAGEAIRDGGGWDFLQSMATRPWTLVALAVAGAALPLWLLLLSRTPLSVAYPVLALSFVAVSLAGGFLFGETLGALRLTGLGLIALGVVLVGVSPS